MDAIISRAEGLRGRVTLPADKAIGHRALLTAAIASGDTVIAPWPSADDCQRTLALVQELGVSVSRSGDAVAVRGAGLTGLHEPGRPMPCGESGTTLRLAAGLLAGQPFTARLDAAPSLRRRPMRRIIEPLTRMGARVDAVEGSGGELYPPLAVHGRRPLEGIQYELPVPSAQVKSAILYAGLFANGPTTVIERLPTRDHTERTLRAFGADVAVRQGSVAIRPPAGLRSPGRLTIPGDVSSAAYVVVAAACVPNSSVEIRGVGLNPTRTAFLGVLRRMGAEIRVLDEPGSWEPLGSLVVASRPLRGVTIRPEEVPGLIDELPILMVAAACAAGCSRLEGLSELRVKEADRLQSMVDGLLRLGAAVRCPAPDVVEVDGGSLTGGSVDGAGDHRTAMSLAVAALIAGGAPTRLRGADCVRKSFPEFFDQVRQLAGSSTVKTIDKSTTAL